MTSRLRAGWAIRRRTRSKPCGLCNGERREMVKASLFRTKIDDCSEGPKAQEPTKRRRRSGEDLTTLRALPIATTALASTHNRHRRRSNPDLALLGPSCCRYIGELGRY
jgi:hypothetical protein